MSINVWTCSVTPNQVSGTGKFTSSFTNGRQKQDSRPYSATLSKNSNTYTYQSMRNNSSPRFFSESNNSKLNNNLTSYYSQSNQSKSSSFGKINDFSSKITSERSCPGLAFRNSQYRLDLPESLRGTTAPLQKPKCYSFLDSNEEFVQRMNKTCCGSLISYKPLNSVNVLKKAYGPDVSSCSVRTSARPHSNCFLSDCDLSKIRCKKPKKLKLKSNSRYGNCGYVVFIKKPKRSKGSPVFSSKCKTAKPKKVKSLSKPKHCKKKKKNQPCPPDEIDKLCDLYRRKQCIVNQMLENDILQLEDDELSKTKKRFDENEFLKTPHGTNFNDPQKLYCSKDEFLNNDEEITNIPPPKNKSKYDDTFLEKKPENFIESTPFDEYKQTFCAVEDIQNAKFEARKRDINKKTFNQNIEVKSSFQNDEIKKSSPDSFSNKTNELSKELVKPENMFNECENRPSNDSIYSQFSKKRKSKNKNSFQGKNSFVTNFCQNSTNKDFMTIYTQPKFLNENFSSTNYSTKKNYFYNSDNGRRSVDQLINDETHKSINKVVCSTSHYYIYKMVNNNAKKNENLNNSYKNKVVTVRNYEDKPLKSSIMRQNSPYQNKVGVKKTGISSLSFQKMKMKRQMKKDKKELNIEENSCEEIRQKHINPIKNSQPTTSQNLNSRRKTKYILPTLTHLMPNIHASKRYLLEEPGCLSLVSGEIKSKNKSDGKNFKKS